MSVKFLQTPNHRHHHFQVQPSCRLVKTRPDQMQTILWHNDAKSVCCVIWPGIREAYYEISTLIARFIGPTCGPSGADRSQVGPMLAPWTLLSGYGQISDIRHTKSQNLNVSHLVLQFSLPNHVNPVYGVATICHQVRWLRWGHPSLFHTATSLLIWCKMFCVRDIS